MGAGGATSAADITTHTRYDAEGRVVEERRPGSSGTDAGTTRTAYYSAGTHPTNAECGVTAQSDPQAVARAAAWAGLVCLTTTGETPRACR